MKDNLNKKESLRDIVTPRKVRPIRKIMRNKLVLLKGIVTDEGHKDMKSYPNDVNLSIEKPNRLDDLPSGLRFCVFD